MKKQFCYHGLMFLSVFMFSHLSWAWGGRGHALVCETAAYIADSQNSNSQKVDFLISRSFDLGYYCNTPDLIWKRPATYDKERPNHYMNLEAFERSLQKSSSAEQSQAFQLAREEFDRKYPDLPEIKGRSWWRIQEIFKKLTATSEILKNPKLEKQKRRESQAQWLMLAGILGHYVGDLAMPLHVSENYDGQLTHQKGLHHFFEESMVDVLYLQGRFGLQEAVFQEALKQWPKFRQDNEKKEPLVLAQDLSRDSQKAVPELLQRDKKISRGELKKAAEVFKDLLVQRLAKGALYQALFLVKARNQVTFDDDKFYEFIEAPPFIAPIKKAK